MEGRRSVRELLATSPTRAIDLWVAEDLDPSALVDEIIGLAVNRGVPVRRVVRARLEAEARTDAPQGVLAHARALQPVELEGMAKARGGGVPFLVVVDGVTDPHNLGALLRSAACAGATGVVVAKHRAANVTPTVAKAAAGAIEHLPMALVPGIPTALARLGQAGVWTIGLHAGAEHSIYALDLAAQPVALVLGAEGRGLSRLARQRCDVVVAIPQHGSLPSLSVSAAGAVACFEVARARAAKVAGQA